MMRTLGTLLLLIAAALPLAAADPPSTVWDYHYDGTGNIVRIGTNDYHYDLFGRLSDATSYVGTVRNFQQYEYDLLGNLTKIETEGRTPLYIPVKMETNRITPPASPPPGAVVVAGYDEAGNQTQFNSSAYTFDSGSMMATSTAGGQVNRFLYDAEDQRVAVVTKGSPQRWRYTLHDADGQLVREYADDVSGTAHQLRWTRDYVWAGSRPVATVMADGTGGEVRRHFHLDHLGTVRLITDEDGRLLAKHTLYPYGGEVPGSDRDGEVIKFTAHERDFGDGSDDADDVDSMQARYYAPGIGRFLSVDPKFQSARLQSFNRYLYSSDNPLGRLDTDGRDDHLFVRVPREHHDWSITGQVMDRLFGHLVFAYSALLSNHSSAGEKAAGVGIIGWEVAKKFTGGAGTVAEHMVTMRCSPAPQRETVPAVAGRSAFDLAWEVAMNGNVDSGGRPIVLWSNQSKSQIDYQATAVNYAKAIGGVTIADTVAYKQLMSLGIENWPWEWQRPIWVRLSQRFVINSSSDIHVFLQSLSEGKIQLTDEIPSALFDDRLVFH